ncbi:MAG: MBL fold metallo-hydrolase [Thermoproteota archaeon]
MSVQRFTVGRLSTNCYVVGEPGEEALIIDPGFENRSEFQEISEFIENNFKSLKYIVNTHGHPDHTSGNGLVKNRFDAPILIHELGAPKLRKTEGMIFGFENKSPPADILLRDGDQVRFGRITLKVIHTPGHTPGGMSLLGDNQVFTGDTLFKGSIGRTDLPGSSKRDMNRSLKVLADLSEDLKVYPGHGPDTTIGKEKKSNMFLRSVQS